MEEIQLPFHVVETLNTKNQLPGYIPFEREFLGLYTKAFLI